MRFLSPIFFLISIIPDGLKKTVRKCKFMDGLLKQSIFIYLETVV